MCHSDDMRKYLIMGVQGSGKGTQSQLLAADLDIVHISVGDIFRWHAAQHTKLGGQVRRVMAAGEMVADEVTEGVVRDRLAQHDWNYGFVLDGFPRNVAQAEFFMETYDIDAVIHLDLPDSEVRRRVEERRRAAQCDNCGGPVQVREQREDDTDEALVVRLRDYHAKTGPVLDVFRRKEYVITVDAQPAAEVVQQEIRSRLGLPDYKWETA
jgi:adenylate kinase